MASFASRPRSPWDTAAALSPSSGGRHRDDPRAIERLGGWGEFGLVMRGRAGALHLGEAI